MFILYSLCGDASICTLLGMASLLLFPEDDSGDSSQQEEDVSEAGESDDMDTEEILLTDEQLERRT